MTPTRLLTAVLVTALGCVLAVGVTGRPAEPARPLDVPAADRVASLAVLAAWDRARAAAWRDGDRIALGGLYVAESAAGRADRALLSAYAERGLRVTGLRMQRAAVEVVSERQDRLVLRVTDRLVGGVAVGEGHRLGLPRDGWSTRTVVLVRGGGEWRVAEVRDQARPVASTDVTSRSPNS